ncbi:MAG: AAA family ATPase, partial [Bacteroidetes bacterium]|nr:AAA family ATPase [Bacteroidota bacterium]
MQLQQTDKLEMAARFISSTNSHLFLTGKAGTGKTTFLRQLASETHKSFLIVAPTGIAALNAGGVTIHSQFLLPFGSFIPVQEPAGTFESNAHFFTKHTLTRTHTLNSLRKQVLRATELLIIDEVSMLRADIMDAIDFRMRRAKGNYSQSFGGTQLLMIGDLYQLPPIVKEEEWQVLQRHYKSMHFFEAQAFREEKMVSIELDRIFRQSDELFIRILNNLRNNIATQEDIALLNSYYRSNEEIENKQDIITITTHNYIAERINSSELEEISHASSYFEAEILGDFPEKLYPLPLQIELKAGAQVMFVKNDSSEEKRYVNGKLARVDRIKDDRITVSMSGTGQEYTLRKEVWEHKKYTINEESKEVEEEVAGTFEQYPVKLAWAVTVHKSQGLTFEKAIIDVGQAFAPGQVYVALSRLQSLDGLILRTRINTSSISIDPDVHEYTGNMEQQKPLPELLQVKQSQYLEQMLTSTFDFSLLSRQLEYVQNFKADKMEFEDEAMQKAMGILLKRFRDEEKNTVTFRRQLQRLLQQNDRELLLERVAKGSEYFGAFMEENLKQVLIHLAEVMLLTRTKTYRNALSEIDQQIMMAMGKMGQAEHIAACIISDLRIDKTDSEHISLISRRNELWEMAQKAADENPKFTKRKSVRKRKKGAKLEKGETYRITYALIKEGKSIKEIAAKRNLAASTIEAHAVIGNKDKELNIRSLLSGETVKEVAGLIQESSKCSKELHR